MVDFRKLKALTPAETRAQEDGRRAQGRLSTVSNSLVELKRHSAQVCELARRPHQPRFPKKHIACDIYN